jgi:hypothetical protein
MPAISYVQTVFVMVMNTLTDFYLMAIPIPMVWKSRLPKAKKITLLIMFSGGLLEMTFGILRCVSILTVCVNPKSQALPCPQTDTRVFQVGDSDPSQSGYWSVRESFVSFVLTNMPMLYPLLKSFLEKIGTTLAFTHTNGGSGQPTSAGQGYRLESYPHKKTRNTDPNPMPDETRYGSNERIVSLDGESRGAAFSGDCPTAIEDQPHALFGVDTGHEAGRVTVCSGPSRSDARRPTPRDHSHAGGIIVTTEYDVFEGHHMNNEDHHDRVFLDV